jgi:hypothetical protein
MVNLFYCIKRIYIKDDATGFTFATSDDKVVCLAQTDMIREFAWLFFYISSD